MRLIAVVASSGHSQYKQQFCESTVRDSDLFLTSMVPWKLFEQLPKDLNIIVWQNPRPSPTRFCRPLRIQFLKETTKIAKHEMIYMQSQIDKLLPTTWSSQEDRIEFQECRNKDLKKYGEHHSRKISRVATNQNLFNRILISQKHSSKLSSDILGLLKEPPIPSSEKEVTRYSNSESVGKSGTD